MSVAHHGNNQGSPLLLRGIISSVYSLYSQSSVIFKELSLVQKLTDLVPAHGSRPAAAGQRYILLAVSFHQYYLVLRLMEEAF